MKGNVDEAQATQRRHQKTECGSGTKSLEFFQGATEDDIEDNGNSDSASRRFSRCERWEIEKGSGKMKEMLNVHKSVAQIRNSSKAVLLLSQELVTQSDSACHPPGDHRCLLTHLNGHLRPITATSAGLCEPWKPLEAAGPRR